MTDWDTNKHQGRILRLETEASAPPETVYAAWADPKHLARWFVDRARGDAIAGGEMTWYFDSFGYEMKYQVLDAVPNRLLVLGGQPPGRPPFALEIRISGKEGGAKSTIRLVNSGFFDGAAWDEEYEGIASGWILSLGILKHYVETYFDCEKQSLMQFARVRTEPASILRWFTDSSLLAHWLTRSGDIPLRLGAPVSLELLGGGQLAGEVLALSARELAVTWPAKKSVLELKAFAAGAGELMVGTRLTSWDGDQSEIQNVQRHLNDAVARLTGVVGDHTPGS